MRTAVATFLTAATVLASPCAAQIALPVHVLPVMAKLAGAAGTDWMSSLSVSNIGESPADVTAMFFRENQNNLILLLPTHQLVIGPGETVTTPDVLGEWFPDQGNTKGFVVLFGEAQGGDEDPFLLTVAGRVFNNADPGATYGQSVPSGLLGVAKAPAVSNLPGVRADGTVRSNVGVVNLSLLPLEVVISVHGADGTVLALTRREVGSFSLGQWSLDQLGVTELVVPGRVQVWVDPQSVGWDPCLGEELGIEDLAGVFMTYLSRVDRVTGDAEFVLGQSDWADYLDLCGSPLPDIPARLAGDLRRALD